MRQIGKYTDHLQLIIFIFNSNMAEINGKNTEKSSKSDTCTPWECNIRRNTADEDTLQCRICQRRVHFACSELPAYQIQLCLQHKARKYQCRNCVVIKPKLMEKLKIKSAGELQKEIRACENIIKVQQEEITKIKTEKQNSNEKNRRNRQ